MQSFVYFQTLLLFYCVTINNSQTSAVEVVDVFAPIHQPAGLQQRVVHPTQNYITQLLQYSDSTATPISYQTQTFFYPRAQQPLHVGTTTATAFPFNHNNEYKQIDGAIGTIKPHATRTSIWSGDPIIVDYGNFDYGVQGKHFPPHNNNIGYSSQTVENISRRNLLHSTAHLPFPQTTITTTTPAGATIIDEAKLNMQSQLKLQTLLRHNNNHRRNYNNNHISSNPYNMNYFPTIVGQTYHDSNSRRLPKEYPETSVDSGYSINRNFKFDNINYAVATELKPHFENYLQKYPERLKPIYSS